MWSTAVGDQPDLLEYANHGAVAISDTVLSRRVAYCNDGLFTIQTTLYNNRPVYQCNSVILIIMLLLAIKLLKISLIVR